MGPAFVRPATCQPTGRVFGRDLSNLPLANGGVENNKGEKLSQMELESDCSAPAPAHAQNMQSFNQISTVNSSIEGAQRPFSAHPAASNQFELAAGFFA